MTDEYEDITSNNPYPPLFEDLFPFLMVVPCKPVSGRSRIRYYTKIKQFYFLSCFGSAEIEKVFCILSVYNYAN